MKHAALTFDDGPSQWTPAILDLLKKHDAHATFFVLGVNTGYDNTIRRMIWDRHEIGVHGWDHTPVDTLGKEQIADALANTVEQINLNGDTVVRWWRPPWHKVTGQAAEAAEQLGLSYCGVTVDGLDVNRNDNQIVASVYAGINNRAIVGLHDGVASNGNNEMPHRDNTVRAVERILTTLSGEYEFVTVSDLLGGN